MAKRSMRQRAWDQFGLKQIGRATLDHYNKHVRPFLTRCGAKRKSDGEPCRNLPLENGRCRLHGGRVPKGDKWHVVTYPNGKAPDAEKRLQDKLRQRERAAKKKATRLAAMSPAERERYEAWHRARKPGSAADRERRRRDAKTAAEMRKTLQEPYARRTTPEIERLDRELQRLEAERAELNRSLGTGVFD